MAIQGTGAGNVSSPDILINGGTLKFLAKDQLANSMDGTGNPHGVTLSLTSGTLNLNGTQQIPGRLVAKRRDGYRRAWFRHYRHGQSTTYSNNATLTAGAYTDDTHFLINVSTPSTVPSVVVNGDGGSGQGGASLHP